MNLDEKTFGGMKRDGAPPATSTVAFTQTVRRLVGCKEARVHNKGEAWNSSAYTVLNN